MMTLMQTTTNALRPIDITDAIVNSAEHSAKGLRAQGWQGGGAAYDLEACEALLGQRLTRAERAMLEASIRTRLDEGA